jgi:hypothetical protein
MTGPEPNPEPYGYFTRVNVHYVDRGETSVCLFPYTYNTHEPHDTADAVADALAYCTGVFASIGDGTRVIGADVGETWEVPV